MKYKNTDERVGRSSEPEKKQEKEPPFSTAHGYDEPMPTEKPKLNKLGRGRGGSKDGNVRDRISGAKNASVYSAKPHTVWVREDLWLAIAMYCKSAEITKRRVIEEALYNFLFKEERVTNVPNEGPVEHYSPFHGKKLD